MKNNNLPIILLSLILLLIMSLKPNKAESSDIINQAILMAADESGMNPAIILIVLSLESSKDGKIRPEAKGDKGKSCGMGQLKLITARQWGYNGGCIGLFNPFVNAKYVGLQLAWCYEGFHTEPVEIRWHLTLACYNDGRWETKKDIDKALQSDYIVKAEKRAKWLQRTGRLL